MDARDITFEAAQYLVPDDALSTIGTMVAYYDVEDRGFLRPTCPSPYFIIRSWEEQRNTVEDPYIGKVTMSSMYGVFELTYEFPAEADPLTPSYPTITATPSTSLATILTRCFLLTSRVTFLEEELEALRRYVIKN